jgi:hypothetical protein
LLRSFLRISFSLLTSNVLCSLMLSEAVYVFYSQRKK